MISFCRLKGEDYGTYRNKGCKNDFNAAIAKS